MITDRFRDGKFDVVILAGPRVKDWPTAGSRAISLLCAEAGLTVGVFGGDSIRPRGVLRGPVTGGTALLEDTQGRLHRVHARAIVRIASSDVMPSPFEGWRSPGVIPYSTAVRLRRESVVKWEPSIAILGTGNRAFRFGSELLASGTKEVLCIETHGKWGGKRYAGWEVERRRFETLGGRLLEATPLSLLPKGPLIWEFRLQDTVGVRLHHVGRVVSVGPFEDSPGLREYPPGSLLFELEQSALALPEEDVEGWRLEEERGRGLAARIVKALVAELGPRKDETERAQKRSRAELKRMARHREKPFQLAYQGKWSEGIREFTGVPRTAQSTRWCASVECVEEIGCDACSRACPEKAIDLTARDTPGARVLLEDRCTGCGACVVACPSQAIALVNERGGHSSAWLGLPSGKPANAEEWKGGEFGVLANRKGESLGSARVIEAEKAGVQQQEGMLFVEAPAHVTWDGRGMRRNKVSAVTDPTYLAALAAPTGDRVEITLNGEKRLVRDKIPVGLALFEIGQSRPEDALLCPDGSCGLCRISVDGTSKWACQMQVHRGMAVRTATSDAPAAAKQGLCPCMGVTREEAVARVSQGKVRSAEAAVEVTQVTRGTCHGQLCADGFRKLLCDHGIDASGWLDWEFPWVDWTLDRS